MWRMESPIAPNVCLLTLPVNSLLASYTAVLHNSHPIIFLSRWMLPVCQNSCQEPLRTVTRQTVAVPKYQGEHLSEAPCPATASRIYGIQCSLCQQSHRFSSKYLLKFPSPRFFCIPEERVRELWYWYGAKKHQPPIMGKQQCAWQRKFKDRTGR